MNYDVLNYVEILLARSNAMIKGQYEIKNRIFQKLISPIKLLGISLCKIWALGYISISYLTHGDDGTFEIKTRGSGLIIHIILNIRPDKHKAVLSRICCTSITI